MQELPLLVRLAVEAEVRAADWRALAAQQAAAAAAGQPGEAVCWPSLERHTVSRVKQLLEALPEVNAGWGGRGIGASACGCASTGRRGTRRGDSPI